MCLFNIGVLSIQLFVNLELGSVGFREQYVLCLFAGLPCFRFVVSISVVGARYVTCVVGSF
jgi:hypothetical protein